VLQGQFRSRQSLLIFGGRQGLPKKTLE
jgi:hypothetical protein